MVLLDIGGGLYGGAKSSLFNKQPTRLNRVFQWKDNNDLSRKKSKHEIRNYIFTQQFAHLLPKLPFLLLKRLYKGSLARTTSSNIQSCQKNKARMTQKSFIKDGETSKI